MLFHFITFSIPKAVLGVKTPQPVGIRPAVSSAGGSIMLQGWNQGSSSPSKYQLSLAQRPLKMKINLTFQRNNKNVHPNRWKTGLTRGTSIGNGPAGAWTVVKVDIFGLLRVVCTENVLPVWQIWSASAEKSGQILPELIESYPNRQRNILLQHSHNHPYLVPDKWESSQPRIAAAHMISKRTNLFLERYPVGFASPSQFDIARKWGWLDRRKEPDEKSASWKSLSFILQGPGTREADIMSQKSTISVGFLFKQEIRILRFRAGDRMSVSMLG